jgi:hypothetical protein
LLLGIFKKYISSWRLLRLPPRRLAKGSDIESLQGIGWKFLENLIIKVY